MSICSSRSSSSNNGTYKKPPRRGMPIIPLDKKGKERKKEKSRREELNPP